MTKCYNNSSSTYRKDVTMKRKKGRPGKCILCVNDGCIYESMSQAAVFYNITEGAISKQVHGHRKTINGYSFIEISGNESEKELNEIRLNALKTQYKWKGVILK